MNLSDRLIIWYLSIYFILADPDNVCISAKSDLGIDFHSRFYEASKNDTSVTLGIRL